MKTSIKDNKYFNQVVQDIKNYYKDNEGKYNKIITEYGTDSYEAAKFRSEYFSAKYFQLGQINAISDWKMSVSNNFDVFVGFSIMNNTNLKFCDDYDSYFDTLYKANINDIYLIGNVNVNILQDIFMNYNYAVKGLEAITYDFSKDYLINNAVDKIEEYPALVLHNNNENK